MCLKILDTEFRARQQILMRFANITRTFETTFINNFNAIMFSHSHTHQKFKVDDSISIALWARAVFECIQKSQGLVQCLYTAENYGEFFQLNRNLIPWQLFEIFNDFKLSKSIRGICIHCALCMLLSCTMDAMEAETMLNFVQLKNFIV